MNRLLLFVFAFAVPSAAQVALAPGQTIERHLMAGDVDTYTLDLGADRFVLGHAVQHTVDVAVTVTGPAGDLVGAFDGPARGPEPFQFVSAAPGVYTIAVAPFGDAEGRYALTLDRVEPRATTPEGVVDQRLAALVSEGSPGGVVAVVRGGEVVFSQGYGLANVEYGVPNTPSTPFHVASISKPFTAFAVAILADRGLLSLDDDVRDYVPEVPAFGPTITLRHLATHTSGLRDQWSLWVLSGGRMDDVIRQSDLLWLVERQRELNFEPGTEYLYSNTGYMLLAEVVERVTGQPFGAWMAENVFAALGMDDTQVVDDHERVVPGRAYSYREVGGELNKSVLSYATSGATGLSTTAEDLARWIRNLATHEVGGPSVAQATLERGVLASGDTLGYALGLEVDEHRGLRRVRHGGADAGYRAFVAYYPEIDAGVVALGNVASFDALGIAAEVAQAFFSDDMDPAASSLEGREADASVERSADPTVLVGHYLLDGGPAFAVARSGVPGDESGLTIQVDGQPAFPLTALTGEDFLAEFPVGDVRLGFRADGSGGTVHEGAGTAFRRFAPWDPPTSDLEPFVGRYMSPELETSYDVRRVEDGLALVHRRHGVIPLSPTEQDRFQGSESFLRAVAFDRDESGAVVAMRVSEGRVRDLRFERQQ